MIKVKHTEIPSQKKLISSVGSLPIEYFKWGQFPDHFKKEIPHRHEFAELLFFTKEGGVHEIGNKEYKISNASVHYIPKSTVHFLEQENYSEGFTIAFDTNYLELNDIHKFVNPLRTEPFALDLSVKQFQAIITQTELLIQRIQHENGFYKYKCFLLSLELLLNSIASEARSENKVNQESSLLTKFKYLVETNIHQQHKVAWYAAQLNLSVKYLGNSIKQELNYSAKNYILQSLVLAIKQELISGNKPLSLIAFDYSIDSSSLSKLFKKHVGLTMSEYRL